MRKGKKINGLDIFIVVVIIAAVLLGGYKALNINKTKGTGAEAEYIEAEYDVLSEECRIQTVEAVNVGDLLYDKTTGVCIGEITAKEFYPYKTPAINNKGEIIMAEEPDLYCLKVTVKTKIIDKEEGYYINGIVEFKSNSRIETYTKYVTPSFVMLDIRF